MEAFPQPSKCLLLSSPLCRSDQFARFAISAVLSLNMALIISPSIAYPAEPSSQWYVVQQADAPLRKIVLLGPGDVWTCGRTAGLLHYDGQRLYRVLPEALDVGTDAMDITAEGDLWIVTHELTERRQRLYHIDPSGKIHCVQEVVGGWIQDISMVDRDEGWAAGNNGALYRCQDHRWEKVGPYFPNFVYDVEMTDTENGWMVGTDGLVARLEEGRWIVDNSGLPKVNYNSVSAFGREDVWVVGDRGTILHREDGAWHEVESPTEDDLTSVWMEEPSHGYLGSVSGEIFEYRAGEWHSCPSVNGGRVAGIDGTGKEAWALLLSGELLRRFRSVVPQFREETQEWGLQYSGMAYTPSIADFDGDGLPDLYVETKDKRDLAYFNRGDRFERVEGEMGIARTPTSSRIFSYTATSFGDYEGDGDVDCFVVDPGSKNPFKLFLNDGRGTFRRAAGRIAPCEISFEGVMRNFACFTRLRGTRAGPSIFYTSRMTNEGVLNQNFLLEPDDRMVLHARRTAIGEEEQYRAFAFADLDQDGSVDAVVGSFEGTCRLTAYLDRGEGTFESVPLAVADHPARCYDIVGIYLDDLDTDGRLDLVLVESGRGLRVLLQEDGMVFRDVTKTSGIDSLMAEAFFSVALGDLDNDGDVDIVYCPHMLDGRWVSRFYLNDGEAHFQEVSALANLHGMGGSPVLFDADNDGDLDLYVAAWIGAPCRFYLNLHDRDDGLLVRVRSSGANRFSLGATVRLFDAGHPGEMDHYRGMRIVGGGGGPIGTNHLGWVHFGAPAGPYDVEVTFPGGKRGIRRGVRGGEVVTVYDMPRPARDLALLSRALSILTAKRFIPIDLLKPMLIGLLAVFSLRWMGSRLVDRNAPTILLVTSLSAMFLYLDYRWIDSSTFRREVAPSLAILMAALGLHVPGLLRRRPDIRRVADYVILDRIGEGATAVVYRAKEVVTGKVVALKVLHGYLLADERNRRVFEQEAEVGIGLHHPNLVEIYERGRAGDVAYIAMEYVEGAPLSDRIRQGEKVPEEEVLDVARQVLSGLAFLHDSGVIHRDVKSDNIMMTREGKVKIMDFGLSKFLFSASRTVQGALVGTLRYISPEQAAGRPVDRRSDLYSVGAVMYELLTGRVPFESENEVEIIHRLLNDDAIPPAEHRPDLSPWTDLIVRKSLKRDRAHRYHRAEDMARDCELARRLLLEGELATWCRQFPSETESGECPALRDRILHLGEESLYQARSALEAGSSHDEVFRLARRAIDCFGWTGEKDRLARAHGILFHHFTRKGDGRSALLHLRRSFRLVEEVLEGLDEKGKAAYLADQEIVVLVKEAKGLIEKGEVEDKGPPPSP